MLGAPLLPATSWLLLRRVPLGLSFVGTTLGTVLGGVLGWVLGGGINNPLRWPVGGALIGFFAAVIVLRARFSSRGAVARPVPRPVA
jgi:drug/metabolite transporter (DMT)-like permease